MFCPSCGNQNPENSSNCGSCGGALGGVPDPRMGYQAPGGVGAPSPTYLVQSILVTIFCCQIFGIVAIVFSAIAMGKNSAGDFDAAADSAAKAKLWCWLGFGIGLLSIVIWVGFSILAAAAGAAGSTP